MAKNLSDELQSSMILAEMIDLLTRLRAEYPETYAQINQEMGKKAGNKDLHTCWNLLILAFTLVPIPIKGRKQ